MLENSNIENSPDILKITKTTEGGSLGLFPEYPEELRQKIILNEKAIDIKNGNTYGFSRIKVPLDYTLNDGREFHLLAKHKEYSYLDKKDNSAVHEVTINRKAVSAYRKEFKEDLPIEKAVGVYIDKNGMKWAIFEIIQNIVASEELPDYFLEDFLENRQEFINKMFGRLKKVGIFAENLIDIYSQDMVCVWDKNETDSSPEFILVDSESWKKFPL